MMTNLATVSKVLNSKANRGSLHKTLLVPRIEKIALKRHAFIVNKAEVNESFLFNDILTKLKSTKAKQQQKVKTITKQ